MRIKATDIKHGAIADESKPVYHGWISVPRYKVFGKPVRWGSTQMSCPHSHETIQAAHRCAHDMTAAAFDTAMQGI